MQKENINYTEIKTNTAKNLLHFSASSYFLQFSVLSSYVTGRILTEIKKYSYVAGSSQNKPKQGQKTLEHNAGRHTTSEGGHDKELRKTQGINTHMR